MSSKHEDKVIFRAREIAAAGYPKGYKLSEWSKIMAMARLSVAREAEAYLEGIKRANIEEVSSEHFDTVLQLNGLIPPPNETT